MGTLSDGAEWHRCHCHQAPTASHCCSWPFTPHPSAKRCWGNVLLMLFPVTLSLSCDLQGVALGRIWSLSGRFCRAVSDCSLAGRKRGGMRRLELGGKYSACVGRAQGALLVCAAPGNPWSLLTLCIILWKAVAQLPGSGRCHQQKMVALLEVGQLPGDAFLGRRFTFGKTWDGSGAQIHHTWLSGLEAPKGTECGRAGGLAQTFFNKSKSCARASQMSCIRISHLPCPLVVC